MSTILVIDDEPHILENVVDLLEASGYQTLSADRAEQGINLAQAHRPDLIVCDVKMPGLSGHDVLQRVRREVELETTPFIFLTAKSTPDDVRDGMSRGADDYLLKPFRADELLEAVEVRLDRQQTVESHYEQHLDDLRRQMSAALPHELRTPLAVIQGYAEVLRNDWDDLPASDGQSMLDEILSATDRLKRLTENYALYVELEAQSDEQPGGYTGDPAPVAVVREAASEQIAAYERKDDVHLDMEGAMLAMEDRYAQRLAAELVDNALKFSAAGDRVVVEGCREADCYRFRVVDHGRGMDDLHLQQLGAFVQFDRSTYEQQGVGLGLALVHRIAQHSDGDVQITSEEGEGTTVDVVLPVASSGGEETAA
jgi:signal transduction histidine kinase